MTYISILLVTTVLAGGYNTYVDGGQSIIYSEVIITSDTLEDCEEEMLRIKSDGTFFELVSREPIYEYKVECLPVKNKPSLLAGLPDQQE